MLLIERLFANFTIWLCDLMDLTQVDIDRYKQRELGLKATPQHAENEEAARRAQIVVRFRG
ncbi:hypothetical protein [Nisaea denitrificans]|uniref:hypothetical protein n=1 Tax=Nisaea denitrificans TaxID=390877 RepID=UPI0003F65142|nr:hypothetical protein [Nisaea denitrificans]